MGSAQVFDARISHDRFSELHRSDIINLEFEGGTKVPLGRAEGTPMEKSTKAEITSGSFGGLICYDQEKGADLS
jgi:hypothetical protein